MSWYSITGQHGSTEHLILVLLLAGKLGILELCSMQVVAVCSFFCGATCVVTMRLKGRGFSERFKAVRGQSRKRRRMKKTRALAPTEIALQCFALALH